MQKEMVVNIGVDGGVTGLHFDEFPLSFLGKMQIVRASEILWDDMAQSWYVQIPGQTTEVSEAANGFRTYAGARRFEVDWLQQCMKEGKRPDSPQGECIALELRLRSDDY